MIMKALKKYIYTPISDVQPTLFIQKKSHLTYYFYIIFIKSDLIRSIQQPETLLCRFLTLTYRPLPPDN